MKKLCEDLGLKFKEKRGFDFVEAVSKVRSVASGKESLVTFSDFREEVTVVQSKRGGGKLE